MLRMQDEKIEDVDICVIYAESHDTKYFPSVPRLMKFYQENNGECQSPKKLCYVAQRRPWKFSQPNMIQETNSQFQGYAHPSQSNWNTPFPWKPWPSQPLNQS